MAKGKGQNANMVALAPSCSAETNGEVEGQKVLGLLVQFSPVIQYIAMYAHTNQRNAMNPVVPGTAGCRYALCVPICNYSRGVPICMFVCCMMNRWGLEVKLECDIKLEAIGT